MAKTNLVKNILELKESMHSNQQVLMYFSEAYKNNTHNSLETLKSSSSLL